MEELTEKKGVNYSDIIVAIDLGSYNIRGMIGRKTEDGKLNVLFASTEKSEGIRNGIVINVDEVSFHIKSLIVRLRNVLNSMLNEGLPIDSPDRVSYDISKVYVGLHGKTIHGELNEISRCFASEKITEEDLRSIEYENLRMKIDPNKKIVDVVPFEYVLDDENVVDNPVGCICHNIRGRFLNVHSDRMVEDNLLRCFNIVNDSVGKDPSMGVRCEPNLVLHSRHISDAVLSSEQKEVGCMLLDFGAQTISMSIYHERKLCYLHVFNFGSDLITQDIASMRFPWNISEKLKCDFGSAVPGLVTPLIIDLPDKRQMDNVFLAQVIESRVKDFIQRINCAIDMSGYRGILDSIVIIGGGAKLNHLIELIEAETGISTRNGDIRVLSHTTDVKYTDIANASVVGIMMAANSGSVTIREVPKEKPDAKSMAKKKPSFFNKISLFKDSVKESVVEKTNQFFEE